MNLPIELLNKILIMRPTHPTAQLINKDVLQMKYLYRNINLIDFDDIDNFYKIWYFL